jgi:Ca2+-transporting ATPase
VVVTVVIGLVVDVPDPGVMQRPPRSPGTRIVNRAQMIRWFVSGFVVAASALCVLEFGPGEPSTEVATASMTMAFAVVALSSVNMGLVMRREREPVWASPVFPYMGWILLGWALTWAAVELGMFQRMLQSTSLTGGQWLVCIGLSAIAPLIVWIDKMIQLRKLDQSAAVSHG